MNHPVLQLRIDADGSTNLPHPRKASTSSKGIQPLFALAIRHAQIDGGTVSCNDRKSSLDADLHDLTLLAAFDPAHQLYSGILSYRDGHLLATGYRPVPHELHAEFEVGPTGITLRQAHLQSGNSWLNVTGHLADFNNPRVALTYHAALDSAEAGRALRLASPARGTLALDGTLDYAARPNVPPLKSIVIDGTLRSARLELRPGTVSADAHDLRARYRLADGNAELPSFSAALLGGSVEGRATIADLAGHQRGSAHLRLSGLSLSDLRHLAAPATASDVTLSGALQADADATWNDSLRNIAVTTDAILQGAAGSSGSSSTVPVNAEMHARYRNRDQQLTLRQSSIKSAHTILTMDGTTGGDSQVHGLRMNDLMNDLRMNVALDAADLHELETIAAIFSPPAQPLDLAGSAKFSGTLSGPIASPRLTGDLSASNLRIRGSEWKQLRARLDAGRNVVEIQNGQLVPVKGGYVSFSGRVEMDDWHVSEQSPIQLTMHAHSLDAAELSRLAGLSNPIGGSLNADVVARGSAENPIGDGRIELLRASAAGESIRSAIATFNGDGDTVHLNLNLVMAAGSATGVLTYFPRRRGYQLQLNSQNFHLDRLQAVKARDISIAGELNLAASGQGTLDDPQLTASVEIPQLRAQGETIDQLALNAAVANHAADITLEAHALSSEIRAHAAVELTGDYPITATLDTQKIPLQPLFATYAPEQTDEVSGATELHATLQGPLKHRERLEAHVVIPSLELHYGKSIELAAASPIHADYANGVLNLQRSAIRGSGTDLQIEGSLPLADSARRFSLVMLGTVDLRLAQLFDPDVTSSGQLRFDVNSQGERSNPSVQGDVRVIDASFVLAGAPLGLTHGNGTLALAGNRLNITSFEGTVGGGKVTAKGGIIYRPALQFDILFNGDKIRMLFPDGVRQQLSIPNLALTGAPIHSVLRGQVNVDQLSFTPDFELSNLASLAGNSVQEPPTQGIASNMKLDVSVRSTQNVNLASKAITVNGSANLRATGTAAEPVILGRISLTGGDLLYQGNRFVLQNGIIDFVNPARTEPNINVSVTTTIQQYNISMRFEGPLENLRTSYSSDPALPPADIINLLAFGQTREAQAAQTAGSGGISQSAEQIIASGVTGQITSRLQKVVGISQLSVDPTLGGGTTQQNPGANVTVQQRVTSKIFVTYSTDVTNTENQVIQVQYQATPRVSVSTTRDQNGGFGFETRITREW
jgi:translocation and assembly module TamB